MNTLTAVSRWFSSRPPVNALGDPSQAATQHSTTTRDEKDVDELAAAASSGADHSATIDANDNAATRDQVTSLSLREGPHASNQISTRNDDDNNVHDTLFLSATRSTLPSRVSLATISQPLSAPPPYSQTDAASPATPISRRPSQRSSVLVEEPKQPPVVQDEENGSNEWSPDLSSSSASSTEPTKAVPEDPLSVTEKTAEPVSGEPNEAKVIESEDEGERRLALKQRRWRRDTLSRSWPVRVSVSIYMLLRRLLALLGLPLSPRLAASAPLLAAPMPAATTTTNDEAVDQDTSPDELLVSLRNSTQQFDPDEPSKPLAKPASASMTHKLSRTAFFLKRATPLSRSSSPLPSAQVPASVPRPPRMTPKTLVLDLDETLIHSTSRPYAPSKRNAGLKVRVVEVVLDGRSTVYTVYKRPWVDFFLRKVSTWYTVIIFTASLPEYADPVIDWLDGGDGSGGMVAGRLFRSDCVHANGAYVKDLTVVEQDLSRVCLVDNSPVSYAINQANGIPIEGWINDPNDECLLDLLPMLDSLRFTNDVRRVLGLRGFR
ncbi:Nuclear envelope morphology protein 1 [Microbotryomycetes sp. JL201]|nr:Nuclear envelope morphology protein 1 [Microbotryomycetes sp. JL201]